MSKSKISLIGRKKYKYNDNITVIIPTISQIRGDNEFGENAFWQEVNLFVKTPSDMISELDSLGIDFEGLSDYKLFTLLFVTFIQITKGKSMIFENFDLWSLKPIANDDDRVIYVDKNGKEIINERVYNDLSIIITTMIGTEKTPKKKFGNDFAKKMRIQQDYKDKERARKRSNADNSFLDSVILRLVCNNNFPYDFETIGNCTIYDTMQGLKQIEKDISVNELMDARLVGADLNKLPKSSLSRYAI